MSIWTYQEKPVTEIETSVTGFIYVITNLLDGRKYIGKKKATSIKTTYKMTTRKNGEKYKKKIKSIVESDWREYYGSSLELQNDVKTLGEENFKREIVRWCYSLSEMSYYEIKSQLESDAILHPDKFYNAYVGCRINRMHMIGKNNSSFVEVKNL